MVVLIHDASCNVQCFLFSHNYLVFSPPSFEIFWRNYFPKRLPSSEFWDTEVFMSFTPKLLMHEKKMETEWDFVLSKLKEVNSFLLLLLHTLLIHRTLRLNIYLF